MAGYFIKVTIIWSVLLLVYILALSKTTYFRANRVYLLLGMAAGILLPLAPTPWQFASTSTMEQIITSPYLEHIPANTTAPPVTSQSSGHDINWQAIATWIYIVVSGILLLLSITEVIRIFRKAIYGQYITISGFRIFETFKPHAPFSFIGWIFINRVNAYSEEELSFLLHHEQAHNRQKHWIDLILVQLCCIAFWINPLVWIFRRLLKMQHEFEADGVAASDNRYHYGQFLLSQVLLKGTPSIAHSFHYSPIKNRITMLSRTSQSNKWRYVLIIPALTLSTLITAKSNNELGREKDGNTTTFKNNRFEWLERAPKDVVMGVWGTDEKYIGKVPQRPIITKMNADSVYLNDNPLLTPAQFRSENKQFFIVLNEAFRKVTPVLPDTIQDINLMNLVIDKKGKIVYYDLEYHCKSSGTHSIPVWDRKIEEALALIPDWLPALKDGAPVNSFIEVGGAIRIKPVIYTIMPISKAATEENRKRE